MLVVGVWKVLIGLDWSYYLPVRPYVPYKRGLGTFCYLEGLELRF
jgi:hypothetical protein